MNFLEICQEVVTEADLDSGLLTTTAVTSASDPLHVKIVHWVNQQNRRIQRKSDAWKFHHHFQEILLVTEDGQADYPMGNVKEVVRDSVKTRRVGTTGEYPLRWLTSVEWLDAFRIRPIAAGQPSFITQLPNRDLRLYPTPSAQYEVVADWLDGIVDFEGDESEPLWGRDMHEILVWLALESYAEEFDSSELQARIARNLPPLWNSLFREYLPDLEENPAFM